MDGKRLREAKKGVDRQKLYPVEQAVKLIKERAKAKFDETIEIAMNLGVDPRHADQMVRGVCALPNGTGRSVRVHRLSAETFLDASPHIARSRTTIHLECQRDSVVRALRRRV